MKSLFLVLLLVSMTISCHSYKKVEAEKVVPSSQPSAAIPTPVPAPSTSSKAYHISGNIDEAVQEDDVCDISQPFTVAGTLKFEFTPSTPTKGKYTYSGPFNATGSGPYEIFPDGKMLVSGVGCIMGNAPITRTTGPRSRSI